MPYTLLARMPFGAENLYMRILALLLLSLGMIGCARREVVVVERPARPGWTELGERVVDGNYDHDVIEVGAGAGRWNKLMFIVEHHAIEIFDVKVVLGDGSRYDIPTRFRFA